MRTILSAAVCLLALSDQPPPAGAPRDRLPTMASLSGRIVERETGRPVPRALVTLQKVGTAPRMLDAVADDHGRYAFADLAPGEYALWAGPGELRAAHLRQVHGDSEPPGFITGTPRPTLVFRGGEALSGVDIALWRALAIEGRVLNAWDEPMAEVGVRAVPVAGAATGSEIAYSDDRGDYRIFGLAAGRYRVCASPQHNVPGPSPDRSRYVRTCHLATTSESAGADIVLEGTDAAGIDIRVQRAATQTVEGSVLDATGALVAGAAHVSARRENDDVSTSAVTRDGRFVLYGLLPGRYLLHASAGGPDNPSDVRPPAREREVGHAYVEVGHDDLMGVQVHLSRPQKAAGRVVFDGAPVPRPKDLRMAVYTYPPYDRWNENAFDRVSAPVDDELAFELKGLYRFPSIIGIEGLPDGWVLQSVTYGRDDITGRPIDLGDPSRRDRLEIVLSNRLVRPAFRVIDGQGNSVLAYQVVVLPAEPSRWPGTHLRTDGTLSADGMLQLGPTPPGEYLVAALAPSDFMLLLHERSRIESLGRAATKVRLAPNDTRVIELPIVPLPSAGR